MPKMDLTRRIDLLKKIGFHLMKKKKQKKAEPNKLQCYNLKRSLNQPQHGEADHTRMEDGQDPEPQLGLLDTLLQRVSSSLQVHQRHGQDFWTPNDWASEIEHSDKFYFIWNMALTQQRFAQDKKEYY